MRLRLSRGAVGAMSAPTRAMDPALDCELATKVPNSSLALMVVALEAADPLLGCPPVMWQETEARGITTGRDSHWLGSFLARGIARCCAKTTVASLD